MQMEGSQEEATAVALRALGKDVPTHVAVAGLAADVQGQGSAQGRRTASSAVGGDRDHDGREPARRPPAGQAGRPGRADGRARRQGASPSTCPPIEGPGGRTALGVMLGLDARLPGQGDHRRRLRRGPVRGPDVLARHLRQADARPPHRQPPGGRHRHHRRRRQGRRRSAASGRSWPVPAPAAPSSSSPRPTTATRSSAHVPDGLEVFKVGTFDEGRTAVEAIAKGRTGALPRC